MTTPTARRSWSCRRPAVLTANQQLAAEELARPSCGRCGIPRSEYEGHWCLYQVDGVWREEWRGWTS